MQPDDKLISEKLIETRIPVEVYTQIEKIIWDEVKKTANPEEALAPYIFPFENIKKIAESDNIEYKENVRNMADDVWEKESWLDALIIYYILMHIITFLPADIYKLGYTLAKLKYVDLAQKLIDLYESVSTNKKVTCHAIANYYYTAIDIPYKAIEYFEKYLEIDSSNPQVYVTMGYLYGKINDMVSLNKQLEAFKKAYELAPDNPTVVKSLLTAYEKIHDIDKIKQLYPELIKLAPSPQHSLNYGLYLMSWGNLYEGGKYFIERFDLDNYPIGYPKTILGTPTKWNYTDDISDKILLVHYEEGFGDTIMYGRFLPLLKQFAKHMVFIIQPELKNLFSQSPIFDGIELMADIKDFVSKYKSEKFVHIPIMDTPFPLGIDKSFLPYSNGYLQGIEPKVFEKNKFNIGISFSGDVGANYKGRDVEVERFFNIAKINGVQLYSLQVGEGAKTLENIPKDVSIIDLSKELKDFTDTAKAVSGLDLVITTDNVILNLSGALGKETFGLFNKYPNYRWFDLTGEDVKWYNSVKPFQCKEEDSWDEVFSEVEDCIKNRVSQKDKKDVKK